MNDATGTATQVLFVAPGTIDTVTGPAPVPAASDVVVAVDRVGICGTDLHLLDGEIGDPFPLVPGHEFVGTVISIGTEAARPGLRVGDRVVVEMLLACGRCARCREGRRNLCERDDPAVSPAAGRQMGVNIPRTLSPFTGGYGTHLVVPPEGVIHVLPPTLQNDVAVLTEPLAVAVRAVERGRVGLGDDVVIIGPGPIGLLVAAVASAAGARHVIVVGGRPERRVLARSFGATDTLAERGAELHSRIRHLLPGGPDVVIECAGNPTAQQDAIRLVRRGGRVVLAGACGGGAALTIAPDEDLLTREIDILPSFLAAGGYERAITLLDQARFPFASLITHIFPLDEASTALAAVRGRTEGLIKAVLLIPSPSPTLTGGH
ncbi:Sorbitol dehydrogenase [Microbacterium ginsengisoli]|uniref:Sorbitol dehydrogenase n=1 Tax=Microbacterium ginsengisoli TaxID=400772 RepID=A0A0F0LS65_9MICO|nr:alcohol dehydrogenase catalytic domain-containing protein [Microbacterium ginsengisoli]KJL34790.1 Sorbitol dehydrogenase [Microbacterium ginsengisoli]KJL35125.1 Sorbitol dehydrogenase [Microbacterium ginsengisoli]MBN9207597.1 alcohol dehydrogenase catalytic domain-containing protein [Microbacterium ginsengisoli]